MGLTPTKDQLQVIQTLDKPLFVSAGAGSGKSSTLAQRVVHAFTPGSGSDGSPYLSSIDQLLIITFTDAAAAEIREKVRTQLHKASREDLALQIDNAWISTIHSMCARIVRRHALELKVDPLFEMISPVVQSELLQAAQNQVYKNIQEQNLFERTRQHFAASLPVSQRRTLASATAIELSMAMELRNAAANASRGFDSLYFPGAPNDIAAMLRSYIELLQEWLELVCAYAKCSKVASAEEDIARICENIDAYHAWAQTQDTSTPDELAELIKGFHRPRRNYGSGEVKEVAHAVHDALGELHLAVLLNTSQAVREDLIAIGKMIDEDYKTRKQALGVLDNDDLIAYALDALREHKHIAELYCNRFKLVMVDEFQDTNAQQVELIELLSGDKAQHLTTVGDAQQSIYRFRAADVEVFRTREKNSAATSVIKLDKNFRSHADVLAFVAACLGHGALEDFMPLIPGAKQTSLFANNSPRAQVLLLSAQKQGKSAAPADERRYVLAAQVAHQLAQYRKQGASADNMVLLLGKLTNVDTYLEALRAAGLDCVVSGGSTFSSREEVLQIAALLDFLANPHDTENGLFAALTGDMFRISADDLLALATKMQQTQPAPAKRGIDVGFLSFEFIAGCMPSLQLRRAYDVLKRAAERSRSWRIADVLLGAVRESGWMARLEAQGPEGRAILANVLAAIRFIDELVCDGKLGLSRAALEFRRWLAVSQEGPASLAGAKGGAVRVMTVHASKGLEFDIVAVSEWWGSANNSVAGLELDAHEGEVRCAYVPQGATASMFEKEIEDASQCNTMADWARYLHQRTRAADAAESARKLYVALTRAKEAVMLVADVVLSKNVLAASNLQSQVLQALYKDSLPNIGETTHEVGYLFPGADSSQKYILQTQRLLLSFTEDGYTIDSGGAIPEIEGSYTSCAYVIDALSEQAAQEEGATHQQQAATFDIYAQEPEEELAQLLCSAQTYTEARDSFSYSSIAAAQREKEVSAHTDTDRYDGGSGDATLSSELGRSEDEDKATSIGSAFHQLAQAMVESGQKPTEAHIAASAKTWSLKKRAQQRLVAALDVWSSSQLRKEVLTWPHIACEVPFFVQCDCEYGSYAEGYIDLLATNGNKALVIDYKTGNIHQNEDELYAHHKQQAALYAQVLSMRGFSEIVCKFVCVERTDNSGEPTVLSYEFTEGDAAL